MNRMHPTGRTEFSEFQTLWIILLVLRSGIVAMFANCASQRRNNTVLFTFTGHVLLPSLIGCTDTYRGAQSAAPTWFDIFYQRAQRTYCAPTYIDIPTDDILKGYTLLLFFDPDADASAHGASALANGKGDALFHGHRLDQFHRHLDVVSRHHHLHSLW